MFKPSKGLWFPTLITKLCHVVGVQERKTEKIVKQGLPISKRTIVETQPFFGKKDKTTMLDFVSNALKELKEEMK